MKIVLPISLDPVLMRSNPLIEFMCKTYNQKYDDSIMVSYPYRDQLNVQKSLQKQPAIVYQKEQVSLTPQEVNLRVRYVKDMLLQSLQRVYAQILGDKTTKHR